MNVIPFPTIREQVGRPCRLSHSPIGSSPWSGIYQRKLKYVRSVRGIGCIAGREVETLDQVSRKYTFRANDYYLNLIDWRNPDDPIRRIVIPREEELQDWGKLDASDESSNTVVPGVQHKYSDTALVLVTNVCAGYCRYCFRKRLFMDDNEETSPDLNDAYGYIGAHTEITDVLLTGGDPLVMSTRKLRSVAERFAAMWHIRTIRIGSKMPAFNPFRLLNDPDLHALFRDVSSADRALYLMTHFDHPRELTSAARDSILCAIDNRAKVVNQCPLIKGVNDDANILAELFTTMTVLGSPQYYLFQGRPTAGNKPYAVPIVRGWFLFEAARRRCSGLSRRVRFCMSHATGKIEILGVDADRIYMRYHRAKDPADEGRILTFRRDDEAYWLDQLRPEQREK